MKETNFQKDLKDDIEEKFPGAMVFKMDPSDPFNPQGIPDLLVLYKNKWASLEVKKSKSASKRPNQPYYVNKMNEMSYAAFVSPENKKEVLDDLERVFKSRRSTRTAVTK